MPSGRRRRAAPKDGPASPTTRASGADKDAPEPIYQCFDGFFLRYVCFHIFQLASVDVRDRWDLLPRKPGEDLHAIGPDQYEGPREDSVAVCF